MPFRPSPDTRGFSLLETLVAAALVGTAVVALAHLVALGAGQTIASRRSLTALVMAQSKLEQLRALTWAYAPDGTRLSDESTDLSALPPAPVGGTGLRPSPPSSLDQNIAGYVDYLDAAGASVAESGGTAVYTRRWAISPLEPFDPDILVQQVCVLRGSQQWRDARQDACVSAIRVRKP